MNSSGELIIAPCLQWRWRPHAVSRPCEVDNSGGASSEAMWRVNKGRKHSWPAKPHHHPWQVQYQEIPGTTLAPCRAGQGGNVVKDKENRKEKKWRKKSPLEWSRLKTSRQAKRKSHAAVCPQASCLWKWDDFCSEAQGRCTTTMSIAVFLHLGRSAAVALKSAKMVEVFTFGIAVLLRTSPMLLGF